MNHPPPSEIPRSREYRTLRARLFLKNIEKTEGLLGKHHHRKHEDHPPTPILPHLEGFPRRLPLLLPAAKLHSIHPLTPGQPDTRAHKFPRHQPLTPPQPSLPTDTLAGTRGSTHVYSLSSPVVETALPCFLNHNLLITS